MNLMDDMGGLDSMDLSVAEALMTGNITNGDQLLTFYLGRQEYGVDILRVQEIKGWTDATAIPNQPPHMLGVINLRGTIVPIVELRRCFGMESIPFGPTTVVIVVNVDRGETEQVMGIVVDAVSDVYNVNPDDLQPAPDVAGAVDAQFVRGIATVNEQMVIALDVNELLNVEDFEAVTVSEAN